MPLLEQPDFTNMLTVEENTVGAAFEREFLRALDRVGERYLEVVTLVATAADRDAAIERLMTFLGTQDEQVARGVLALRLEELTVASRAARRAQRVQAEEPDDRTS